MSHPKNGGPSAPTGFSMFASRFVSGKAQSSGIPEGSQIFRAPSPSSSTHDPFLPSPSASRSHPHLAGSSRSPSPSRTPPYPGPGIDAIPDIDDSQHSGIGMGLLFDNEDEAPRRSRSLVRSKGKAPARPAPTRTVPNPYASTSSDSEEEPEADLEEVAQVRRSLARPQPKHTPQSERAKRGWLAHQSVFPNSSSSSSMEDDGESEKQTESDTDDEQSRMMGRSRRKNRPRAEEDEDPDDDPEGYVLSHSERFTATSQASVSDLRAGMEEPLLGPDELERRGGAKATIPNRLQVYHGRFGHWEREGLRKYKDSGFLALWLSSILAVLIGLLFVWGSTEPPKESPSHRPAPSIVPLIPLLLVLLIPTIVIPPAFLLLLQKTVRPVLLATAVSIPFSLFVCGWWCLGASFETGGWDQIDQGERWWGTTGLRILAVLLWALAAWFGRLVWVRRKKLERTVAVVELSTHLLLTHTPLLLLTPVLLAVFTLTSLPFFTLIIRLGMIGYWRHPKENTYIYQLRPYAGWLIFLVTLIWVWTWGVIRGVGRVAIAGVIGEWYFHRDEPAHPDSLEITQAAVHRATGTSLGSICLGAGIVATVRVVGRSAAELKRLTSPRTKLLPSSLSFLSKLTPFFAIVAGVLDQLNGYALVYVGITGDAFWPSARKAVGLAGRRSGGHLLDCESPPWQNADHLDTLIKLLLTLATTAMGIFTGTAGYLYMAHSLSNPAYAPAAGLLCGGVPFLAVRAGAAVLGDAADALFICHQIDREAGGAHCEEAKAAVSSDVVFRQGYRLTDQFAGEKPTGAAAV